MSEVTSLSRRLESSRVSSEQETEQETEQEQMTEEEASNQREVSTLEALINTMNNIPHNIYSSTMDLTHNIGSRIRKFSYALRGTGDSESKRDFVSVSKPHYTFAEALRKENPELYTELGIFAKKLSGFNQNTQAIMAKKWFMTYTNALVALHAPSEGP